MLFLPISNALKILLFGNMIQKTAKNLLVNRHYT